MIVVVTLTVVLCFSLLLVAITQAPYTKRMEASYDWNLLKTEIENTRIEFENDLRELEEQLQALKEEYK